MKKIYILIGLFIICNLLVCIILYNQKEIDILGMILSCLSTVASIFLSFLIESFIKSDGMLVLWYQHYLYYWKDIRLSFSYLYRIEIEGKYLLIRGNRVTNKYQPVGGVYKYYPEAKATLDKMNFRTNIDIGNTNDTDDLRINIKGKELLNFMNWFSSMENREYDPLREFNEELIETGLLPNKDFKNLKYRKIRVHNKGILFSKHFNCQELIVADIFELILTEEQKESIKKAAEENSFKLCLASDIEIKKQCYDGIEENIGNNASWLLGE